VKSLSHSVDKTGVWRLILLHKGVVVRSRMRQATHLVTLLSLILFSAALFQNCGTYEAANNPLFASDQASVDTSCVGLYCAADLNNIQLSIANQEPVTVRTVAGGNNGSCDATNCVDVAGYCDPGGYTKNLIYVEIQGPSKLAETPATSCRDNGRFRVLVPMPAGFVKGAIHTLVVTLRVIDSTGKTFDNPSGLNRKQISLTSVP
jgi:hypothetical protein